eukprot:jgi/Botrbrau1/22313/Bobra.0138s0063.1
MKWREAPQGKSRKRRTEDDGNRRAAEGYRGALAGWEAAAQRGLLLAHLHLRRLRVHRPRLLPIAGVRGPLPALLSSGVHRRGAAGQPEHRVVLPRVQHGPNAVLPLWGVWSGLRGPHCAQMLPGRLRSLLPCRVRGEAGDDADGKEGGALPVPRSTTAACVGKSGDGVDMAKCIRCPTAYHSCCMPKTVQRLLPHSKVVLCAKHTPGDPPPRYRAPPPPDEDKLRAAKAAAREAGIPLPKSKTGAVVLGAVQPNRPLGAEASPRGSSEGTSTGSPPAGPSGEAGPVQDPVLPQLPDAPASPLQRLGLGGTQGGIPGTTPAGGLASARFPTSVPPAPLAPESLLRVPSRGSEVVDVLGKAVLPQGMAIPAIQAPGLPQQLAVQNASPPLPLPGQALAPPGALPRLPQALPEQATAPAGTAPASSVLEQALPQQAMPGLANLQQSSAYPVLVPEREPGPTATVLAPSVPNPISTTSFAPAAPAPASDGIAALTIADTSEYPWFLGPCSRTSVTRVPWYPSRASGQRSLWPRYLSPRSRHPYSCPWSLC